MTHTLIVQPVAVTTVAVFPDWERKVDFRRYVEPHGEQMKRSVPTRGFEPLLLAF